MFKKRFLCLLLSALLLFSLLPSAHAQEAYKPGEITSRLLQEAFAAGRMICADMNLSLDFQGEAFGLTAEEIEAVGMLTDILEDSILSVGAAQIEGGIALLIQATYGENPVSADIILSLTQEGAAIESSLLPGEKIFMSWDAALSAAGLDESASAQLRSLSSTDPEQVAELISQSIDLSSTMIAMASAPYLQIFSDFFAALPVETQNDVAAEGQFPAAKSETVIVVTQKALGDLLNSLSTQLENDVTFKPMLDSFLPAALEDPSFNTDALCAAMHEIASVLTDEEYPFYLFMGFDEADELLYASLSTSDAAGITYALNLIDISGDIGSEAVGYLIQAYMTTEEIYNGLSFSFFTSGDSANPNVRTLGAAAELTVDNEILFAADYALDTKPAVTASGLSAYSTAQAFSLNTQAEGEALSLTLNSQTDQEKTVDGGELTTSASLITGYLGDTLLTEQNSLSTFSIAPTDEGFAGAFTGEYTAPQEGIHRTAFTCGLYDLPYAPTADATVLSLDTASDEELTALVERLQGNALPLLESLISQLPEPLRQELTGVTEIPEVQ